MYNIQGKFILKNLEKFTNSDTAKPTTKPTTEPTIAKATSNAIDNVIGEVDTDNHYCVDIGYGDDPSYWRSCKIVIDRGIPEDENIYNHIVSSYEIFKRKKSEQLISDIKNCDRFSSWLNVHTKSDSDCKQLSDDIKEYKDHIKNGCKNKNDYTNLEDKNELTKRLKDTGFWKFAVPEKFSELYYCLNNKSERKLKPYEKGCKNDNQCGENTKCHNNECLDENTIKFANEVQEATDTAFRGSISSSLCVLCICVTLCYLLFFKK